MIRFFVLLLLPLFAFGHDGVPTRFIFSQQKNILSLEALFDPLLLSSVLQARGVSFRLAQSSLQDAAPAVSLWLDERLIVESNKEECPRSEGLTLSLQEGALIRVSALYQCKGSLDALVVRSTLFLDRGDPHPIEAMFFFEGGASSFVFDLEHTTFALAPEGGTIRQQKKEIKPAPLWRMGLWHSLTSPLHWLFAILVARASRPAFVWGGAVFGVAVSAWLPLSGGWLSLLSLCVLALRRDLPRWVLFLLGALFTSTHGSELFSLFVFTSLEDFYSLVVASLLFDLGISALLRPVIASINIGEGSRRWLESQAAVLERDLHSPDQNK